MRTKHFSTIGVAVAVFAFGAATLSGQRERSAPAPVGTSKDAHVHIGHVMTISPETPNKQGFLVIAVADAKVAAAHAGLMQQSPDDLDSMKLHAGHVLHALDATLLATGPGSGYGVERAAAGALRHIQLAAQSAGASQNVQTHAVHVSASLGNVTEWTGQAITTAQRIRTARTAPEAAALVSEVVRYTDSIMKGTDANRDGSIGWQSGEGGLAQAQGHMDLMAKGEGL